MGNNRRMNPIRSHSDRRRFLKAAGVSMALPMLESLPAQGTEGATKPEVKAQRLVCVGSFLGFHQKSIYPKTQGHDYELTPLLKPLADHRGDFTIFSGLDHRAANGHDNWPNFLCGNTIGSVSLDQVVAQDLGQSSRFPSVQLSAGKQTRVMNYTKEGVPLPMIQRPSVFYNRMFATPEDRAHSEYLIKSGRSSLDLVLEEAKRMQGRVSGRDKQKLEEYFGSVRDVEKRMERQLQSFDKPAPESNYELPGYDPIAPSLMFEAEEIMLDLMAIALENDSSRVLTLFIQGLGQVFNFDGKPLQAGYHALSHHGNDPEKIRDLVRVEIEHMKLFARFLDQLKTNTDAEGRPLLDSTIVLFGTGMGDASRHANSNLPTIVAGGGFKDHGQHLAVDAKAANAPLLGDLFITMMQQLGMETDQFANANRNMNGVFG